MKWSVNCICMLQKGGVVKITAKQMLEGVIYEIKNGSVNSDVSIRMPGGEIMTAVMTRSSVEKLKLTIGKPLFKKARLAECK